MLTNKEYFPGVFQITDCMGVCMTLLKGAEKALLIDTGYGLENVKEYVEQLAGEPVDVLLTHGHHDHALGVAPFGSYFMFPEDLDTFRFYTRAEQRARVMKQGLDKGIEVPSDFESRTLADPLPLTGNIDPKTGFTLVNIALGGITACVYRVPGHTEGSAVIYIPEYQLLLTADNWNPCTWCWFPEAKGAVTLRDNMQNILHALPCESVLCSHQSELYRVDQVKQFFDYLTDEHLAEAPDFMPNRHTPIRKLSIPQGMEFVFNADKKG